MTTHKHQWTFSWAVGIHFCKPGCKASKGPTPEQTSRLRRLNNVSRDY